MWKRTPITRNRKANTQMSKVNIMPDSIVACMVFSTYSLSSLLKNCESVPSTDRPFPGMSLEVYTAYKVVALTTWRGPEQKMTRNQAVSGGAC